MIMLIRIGSSKKVIRVERIKAMNTQVPSSWITSREFQVLDRNGETWMVMKDPIMSPRAKKEKTAMQTVKILIECLK